jgi:hypothetical protein
MALTSSSTIADALAQYNDNLSWYGSPTKAAAALQAVRFLLVNRAMTLADGDGQSVNYASLEQEKTALEKYVKQSTTTGSTRQSFTMGRVREF